MKDIELLEKELRKRISNFNEKYSLAKTRLELLLKNKT